MARLARQPDAIATSCAEIEREILWRLINGPLGEAVHQTGLDRQQPYRTFSRAVRSITEHYDQPFRVKSSPAPAA